MKTSIGLLLAAAVSCHAAVIQFGLSPSGTDVAVGLSPSNEVPPAATSTGSGDLISGGITLNTDNNVLTLAIGFGSAAGFTDLTGPATGMHIHLGAPGESGAVLTDLSALSFPAVDPAKGGVIIGNVIVPSAQVSNLVSGFTYVNVHTAAFPDGEVRGQLIALINSPPTVNCGPEGTVECGAAATVTVLVSDPEGDALTVVWSVDGTAMQTNTVPAGSPSATTPVVFTSTLPLGNHSVGIVVTDTASNTASCATLVKVVDTTPPVITSVSADRTQLWPPNHRMIPISLRVVATDSCSSVTWRITRVTSNEPDNGLGDGDTAMDWQIVGNHGLKLRAERSGRGQGRIYTVYVRATDSSGNISEPRTVTIRVPKSQGNNR